MIIIYDNNSDFTAASTQITLNSDSVKHINSEYNHFAWAAFANIYISQFIFSCDQKSILSNTDSNAQFWSCHTIIWSDKVLWSVESDIWCYSEEFNDWSRFHLLLITEAVQTNCHFLTWTATISTKTENIKKNLLSLSFYLAVMMIRIWKRLWRELYCKIIWNLIF